jgi:hypothetical protein
LRRAEVRVGLCRDRLVLARSIVPTGRPGIEDIKKLAAVSRVAVILSNHFVRYAVLPWSPSLSTEQEWLSFAEQVFASTYGGAAANWRIRVCSAGYRQARVASAVNGEVLDALEALPHVVSIQPYLMAAFNSRRPALRGRTAWFVLQEPGRLTLCLFAQGEWKTVRTRNAAPDWKQSLSDVLDRELAGCGDFECDSALVCSEDEISGCLGRYRLEDVTLRRGEPRESRPHVMALH